MSGTGANEAVNQLHDALSCIKNSELSQIIGHLITIMNRLNLKENVEGIRSDISCLVTLIMECDEKQQQDRDTINSMREKIRHLEAELHIKDGEIKRLKEKLNRVEKELAETKQELTETKRCNQVIILREWCNDIELYCIRNTLNMTPFRLQREGIRNYSDFCEQLNEFLPEHKDSYLEAYRQEKEKLGIDTTVDGQMAKIRKTNNKCAHPLLYTTDKPVINVDDIADFLEADSSSLTRLIELKQWIDGTA